MYYRRLLTAGSSPDSENGRLGSADSDLDISPLPQMLPEPSVDRIMGHHVTRPGAALRLPILRNFSPSTRGLRTGMAGAR